MAAKADISISKGPDGGLIVRVAGELRRADGIHPPEDVLSALSQAKSISFDSTDLKHWDTGLLIWVRHLLVDAEARGAKVDFAGLPDGVRRLIALSQLVAAQPPPVDHEPLSFLARVGVRGLHWYDSMLAVLTFLGELAFSITRLATGRAHMRRRDLFHEIAAAGLRSLSIVAVVSFLLGMILAFVGGVTLRPFGASIYVANVVTVAMLRELGAVMTAIVMAGRTGSAYAAQLGTMKVTQEIDALTTMALPPSDFLVLPRVIALSMMMPVLCVYSDFIAVLGGGLVAVATGETTPIEFVRQVQIAAPLSMFWIGLAKSAVFGIIVAVCGCIEGLRADGGAQSVGNAATNAVVTSIIWIIAVDGLFAVVLEVLKL